MAEAAAVAAAVRATLDNAAMLRARNTSALGAAAAHIVYACAMECARDFADKCVRSASGGVDTRIAASFGY